MMDGQRGGTSRFVRCFRSFIAECRGEPDFLALAKRKLLLFLCLSGDENVAVWKADLIERFC